MYQLFVFHLVWVFLNIFRSSFLKHCKWFCQNNISISINPFILSKLHYELTYVFNFKVAAAFANILHIGVQPNPHLKFNSSLTQGIIYFETLITESAGWTQQHWKMHSCIILSCPYLLYPCNTW